MHKGDLNHGWKGYIGESVDFSHNQSKKGK